MKQFIIEFEPIIIEAHHYDEGIVKARMLIHQMRKGTEYPKWILIEEWGESQKEK